jgi:hypothetical protein
MEYFEAFVSSALVECRCICRFSANIRSHIENQQFIFYGLVEGKEFSRTIHYEGH